MATNRTPNKTMSKTTKKDPNKTSATEYTSKQPEPTAATTSTVTATSTAASTRKTTRIKTEAPMIVRYHREPTAAEIAKRAYHIWEQSGWQHGRDVQDWLQAEKELKIRV
jgi:hypothetical protein